MKLTISCAVIVLISVAGYLSIAQAETLGAQRSELVEIQRLRRNAEEESDTSESEVPVCLDGWILNGTTCYLFVTVHKFWETAKADCVAKDSHLLEIDSQAEQDFIYSLPQVKAKTDIWIGMSDSITEGTFLLASSGNYASFTNWSTQQPSDEFSYLDCVEMAVIFSGQWYTANCNSYFAYLCERQAEFPDT